MYDIVLVDDDRNILTSVSILLKTENYQVAEFTDGNLALQHIANKKPHLAILDIKMPKMDGMELLRKIRQITNIPVIFLTSKDEETDEIFGLKMGADDFIRKPFSQKLLLERVKVVLRRHGYGDQRSNSSSASASSGHVKVDVRDLELDEDRLKCSWRGKNIVLTVAEFLLLQKLARHPGNVNSRNALIEAIYDEEVDSADRTIDSHVKRLRQKFKNVDPNFDSIETVYGAGYRFKSE